MWASKKGPTSLLPEEPRELCPPNSRKPCRVSQKEAHHRDQRIEYVAFSTLKKLTIFSYVTPFTTPGSHRLLKERSANYARVLSLGLNVLTRAEVAYPPIIDPGDSFSLGDVTPKKCFTNHVGIPICKIRKVSRERLFWQERHQAHRDQRGLKPLSPNSGVFFG